MRELSDRLLSNDIRERIKATYEVSVDAIRDSYAVVTAMRENLDSDEEDLLEITVMRLGLRAYDIASLDRIIQLSRGKGFLLSSAAVLAMASIAKCHPTVRDKVAQNLDSMKKEADNELLSIIEDELLTL